MITQQVVQETLIQTKTDPTLSNLLKILTESNTLETWQEGIIRTMESFLDQAGATLKQHSLSLLPVMISYVPHKSALIDSEAAVKVLHYCFSKIGIPTTLCPLLDTELLQSQLAEHRYAIVLCTPQYAGQVTKEPAIRAALDAFGRTKKNALQPLLCEGGFADTALKIVDSHYLIRSYQVALRPDPLTSMPHFMDIVLNISGNQGLGLLPDILDLKETVNAKIEEAYQAHVADLQQAEQNLTVNYRLKASLTESIEKHPFKSYLETLSLPVIKEEFGFQPIVQELLNNPAKVSLLLCQTKADTELSGLALTDTLLSQGRRVLSIECADYPGKLAGDCVRLALQKLKLKRPDIEVMKQEPLLILVKGYENIGAYDNLWVKNRLSTWANVKLLVTCRADFFKFRGYLSCFLANVSNRQVDDLLVYKVPTFTSEVSQKMLLTRKATVLEDTTETWTFNPKQKAESLELTDFLKKVNQLWIEKGYLKSSLAQNPQVFMSYAWEADKTSLARQQGYLSQISQDLTTLGFPTWLDIERMSGDINEQMAGNIANSQAVVVIQTPRYTERSTQNTNVKKEFDAIIQKSQNTVDFRVFPLKFLPGPLPSALDNHPNQCDFTGVDEDYVMRMTHPDLGFIPQLLLDHPDKKTLYQTLYVQFQEQLQLLTAKHLIVNQGQDEVQAFDIDNRLKGYIEPYGLVSETSSLDKRFDLNKHFQAFLDTPQTKVSIVLGRAGSGKSLFALSTFKAFLQQWHDYRNGTKALPQWLPIYIQLRNHAKDPEKCIENTLLQFLSPKDIEALKQGLHHQQRILFILDGYDELGSDVRPNLSQSLNNWPLAKLLITGRPEHFDKDHQPLETLSLYSLEGQLMPDSAQEVYVSPFVADEIKRYVDFYTASKQGVNQTIYENAYETLQNLPGMMALLDNPFLLTLVLQALPQLLKNREGIQRAVTRTDIYQAFTETWFLQETKGRELAPTECEAFSQELAFRFFQANTISVSNIPEKQDLWAFFDKDTTKAAQDASPLRFSGGEYSFVHKSLYEYFTAKRLWQSVFAEDCLSLWQVRPLTEERPIIDFLSELYRTSLLKEKEHKFMQLLEGSRQTDFPAIASSNAITVLNAARVCFSGKVLQNIRIPGADLSDAILDNTNLESADLSNVTLSGAWLHGTNLKNAILTDLILGEYPSLLLQDMVSSISYSPDGRLLAIAQGKNIHLYDGQKRVYLRMLVDHEADSAFFVTDLAFSPDGRWLASASIGKTVKIWDIEKRKMILALKGHAEGVGSVAFSPNGKWLASAGYEGKIKLWDIEAKKLKYTLDCPGTSVVTFSPDGRWLASGSIDIKLWDSEIGELKHTLKGAGGIYSLTFSPDGKLLAVGSWGNTIKLWDSETQELRRSMEGHTGSVKSIVFSPDGRVLASGSEDKTVKLWDSETGKLNQTLSGHTEKIDSVVFSPNGKLLVSGSRDKTVRFWDTQQRQLKHTLKGHTLDVTSVAFSPDGKVLVSGSKDKTVKLWDSEQGELEHTFFQVGATSVTFSTDGRLLAASDNDMVSVWDLEERELVNFLVDHGDSVTSVAFSSEGNVLASGSKDKTIKLWDSEQGEVKQTLSDDTQEITCLVFSPDGRVLASGSADKAVKLWDSEQGELKHTLLDHIYDVTSVAFSPDGKLLASGSHDGKVNLWDVEQGELQHTLRAYMDVFSVVFSPDGRLLAASGNKAINIWQGVLSEAESCYRTELQSSALSIALKQTADGEILLISGHSDASIKCWKLVMVDQKFYLQLLWTTHQNVLLCQDTNLKGTKGLSVDNAALLKQRGAIGEPAIEEEKTIEIVQLSTQKEENISTAENTLLVSASIAEQSLSNIAALAVEEGSRSEVMLQEINHQEKSNNNQPILENLPAASLLFSTQVSSDFLPSRQKLKNDEDNVELEPHNTQAKRNEKPENIQESHLSSSSSVLQLLLLSENSSKPQLEKEAPEPNKKSSITKEGHKKSCCVIL